MPCTQLSLDQEKDVERFRALLIASPDSVLVHVAQGSALICIWNRSSQNRVFLMESVTIIVCPTCEPKSENGLVIVQLPSKMTSPGFATHMGISVPKYVKNQGEELL